MSITAIILLVVAACTHAGWNLIGKRSESTILAFILAATLGLVVLAPFPLVFMPVIGQFNRHIWILILGTGAFQAIYYASLSLGYRHGDMSFVYPFARSIPAVLVVVFSLLTGSADRISGGVTLGIVLIVTGSVMLPMVSFRSFNRSTYVSLALLFALIAAIGTAGYSIIDDRALDQLRIITEAEYHPWQITGVFAFFEGVSSVLWLIGISLALPKEREGYKKLTAQYAFSTLPMGIGIYVTYTIVLLSMAFVRDVSYVVAFRQLSIPIGVLLSGLLLKEKIHLPRMVGALLMFSGVVIVGIA